MSYFTEQEAIQAEYARTNTATTDVTPTKHQIELICDIDKELNGDTFSYDDYKKIRETLVNLVVENNYTFTMIRKVLDQLQLNP